MNLRRWSWILGLLVLAITIAFVVLNWPHRFDRDLDRMTVNPAFRLGGVKHLRGKILESEFSPMEPGLWRIRLLDWSSGREVTVFINQYAKLRYQGQGDPPALASPSDFPMWEGPAPGLVFDGTVEAANTTVFIGPHELYAVDVVLSRR